MTVPFAFKKPFIKSSHVTLTWAYFTFSSLHSWLVSVTIGTSLTPKTCHFFFFGFFFLFYENFKNLKYFNASIKLKGDLGSRFRRFTVFVVSRSQNRNRGASEGARLQRACTGSFRLRGLKPFCPPPPFYLDVENNSSRFGVDDLLESRNMLQNRFFFLWGGSFCKKEK